MGKKFLKLLAAVLIVAAFSVVPSLGTTHAVGAVLTTSNTHFQYTSGPVAQANPSDANGAPLVCDAAAPCFDTPLTVAVPAGTDKTKLLKLGVSWPMAPAEFDLFVLDKSGNILASSASSNSPQAAAIPAVSGTYTLRVVPFAPLGESYTLTADLNSKPVGKLGTGVAPRYATYHTPGPFGTDAGEPSIGVDPKTDTVLFQSLETTIDVNFNDSTSPAQAKWTPYHAPTAVNSLDPIGFMDQRTGRYFESQLSGSDSLTEFTDDNGKTWTPSQGGGIPSGVDHQTIGGGPYHAGTLVGALTAYKDAVYYCSQDLATAFCARSDDGGLTFGAGVPVYSMLDCAGIHGHVRVAPDGTVYLPARSCDGHQAVVVSTDNGQTWQIRTIPASTPALGNDPSVGIATDGTLYFGYQNSDGVPHIAVSHDQGKTWINDQPVGTNFHIQNSVFPEVTAGDPNRAAFAFVGTPTGGNFQDTANFNGVWHMYVATTYDGGVSWITVDATPNDPVQRGSICTGGTTCGHDRNLLDFNDTSLDSHGRVLVGYSDGCISSNCINAPANPAHQNQYNDFTAVATITRESGGRTLFKAYDKAEPTVPAKPHLTATSTTGSNVTNLSWDAPDNGGSLITHYNVYRGTSPSALSLLASTTQTTRTDATHNNAFYYAVAAVNAKGQGAKSDAVQPTVSPVTVAASPCTLPGVVVDVGTEGGQKGGPTLNTDLNILSVAVAEPYAAGQPNHLVFSMKVKDLSGGVAPSRQWMFIFYYSGIRYYVRADSTGGVASFDYGTLMPAAQPLTPVALGNGLAGSSISTSTNTITISIPTSGLNADPTHATGPQAGDSLTELLGRTFIATGHATVTPNSAIDATPFASYKLVGNAACKGK